MGVCSESLTAVCKIGVAVRFLAEKLYTKPLPTVPTELTLIGPQQDGRPSGGLILKSVTSYKNSESLTGSKDLSG